MKSIAILFLCLAVVKGHPSKGLRIIGGTEGDISEFPSLVSLTYKDEHFCGGFIYNERFVVTTAYCVKNYMNDLLNINVYAGQINLILPDATEQRKGVRQIYMHESYEPTTKINDIALVELTNPFNVTEGSGIAVGIFDEVDADGNLITTFAGWGAVQVGGLPSVVLQETKLNLFVAGTECQVYGDSDFQTNTMICAGPYEDPEVEDDKKAYPCLYDEGSPLFQEVVLTPEPETKFIAVVGIMSKNKGCEETNREEPTVFTRLSAYYAWLFRIAGAQPAPESK